jgi:predicted  nucleic acid-binding Zn-ribbon protein
MLRSCENHDAVVVFDNAHHKGCPMCDLEGELEDADADIVSLREDVARLEDQNQQLRERVDDLNNELLEIGERQE